MTEAVTVPMLISTITLATILIASAAGGLLLWWIDGRTEHEH